ncbi:MAG: hypothetical protein K2X81_05315, partial [Candidatus Obscuribacterales bacterium]|nr:hypothetical protein [Candidatus Obscuribacterales bacterium]
MSHDEENPHEFRESHHKSAEEKSALEAINDKKQLAESVKTELKELKAGRSSGITKDFGRPILLDDSKSASGKKNTEGLRKAGNAKSTAETRKSKTTAGIEKRKVRKTIEQTAREPKDSVLPGNTHKESISANLPGAQSKPSDNNRSVEIVETAAKDIRKATKRDAFIDTGTGEKTIYA